MAPVELVRLTWPEQQRDERSNTVAGVLAPGLRPVLGIAPHGVVRTLEPLAPQQIVDPRHPQPIASMPRFIPHQQRIEPLLEGTDPRQRLNRAMIVERTLGRPDRLAHNLARQPQIARNRLDRLAARMLAPDPDHCLHHQHPDLATWKTRPLPKPSK